MALILNADDEGEDGYDEDAEENGLEVYVDAHSRLGEVGPLEARSWGVDVGYLGEANGIHVDEN